MSPGTVRALRLAFWVYVAVTIVHIAYVVNHEPFSFDAWNVARDTGAKPFSFGNFFAFWKQQYTTSNPRIGQPLTYFAYKVVGVAEVGTPLAFFAILVGGFALGTGRFPSRTNGRDLATLAIGIGVMWFVSPNMPAYMFCRAYATNYIWAIAIQLWFLVPIRLGLKTASVPRLIGYFLIGVVAGMCNEHTGPTLIAVTVGWAFWRWRKDREVRPLVLVLLAGAIVGYAIIFFAPGQSQRYEGIAEHFSAVQQILVRGIAGNTEIYLGLLEAAAPVLVVALLAMAIGMVNDDRDDAALVRTHQQRALGFLAVTFLAASLITITVFASPKLGPRFYLHATMLLLAALLGVIHAFVYRPRAFAPFLAMAVLSSGYAIARTVPSYHRTALDSQRRLSELAATRPGGVYTASAWDQVGEGWWTLGDDLRDQLKQEFVAQYFGLDRVLFRGGDQWKPLGLSDVKLTMHYDIDPAVCLDQLDQLEIKPWMGRDVKAIQHAFLDAITNIRRVSGSTVKSIDLTASFLGDTPPLPRKKLYVARWANGELEGYVSKIARSGRTAARQLVLPKNLVGDWDMYVMAVGDPPKLVGKSTDKTLSYEPWTSGTYWVLACKPDYCFVTSSTVHVVL
ncbi:MAG: DUF6056 family protein [Kofleriaceae bacterium]